MFRFLRRLISASLLLGSGLLALWSFAALGGAVSDNLDVLTHFAPIPLAAALVLLAGARMVMHPGRARRNATLAAAAAVVWSGVLVVPELLAAARRPDPPAGQQLKLVTFNIWGDSGEPERTADVLLATDADVILMQEVFGLAAKALPRLREKYPYGSVCTDSRCSLAVLSRYPVRANGLQRQNWRSEDPRALSAAWAEIEAPGGRFVALTTHYTWPTQAYAQEWQRGELVRLTRQFPRDDLIVTGDFNSTPWSKALREQDARLGLIRRTRALFSWPARRPGRDIPFPLLPIDHVYAGQAWRTVSVKRGPRAGSDHYPVIVTLARDQPPSTSRRTRSSRAASALRSSS